MFPNFWVRILLTNESIYEVLRTRKEERIWKFKTPIARLQLVDQSYILNFQYICLSRKFQDVEIATIVKRRVSDTSVFVSRR